MITIPIADSWIDLANLAVLGIGTVFGLVQLRWLRKQLKDQQIQSVEEAARERRRRTLEIDARIAGHQEQRTIVETAFPPARHTGAAPLAEIEAAIADNPKLEASLTAMLTQFEILALPVVARVADEDMAFELIGGSLSWYSVTFREYIEARRTRERRADLYAYFTYLGDRWQQRLGNDYRLFYTLDGERLISSGPRQPQAAA
jgi:hypothetical protein